MPTTPYISQVKIGSNTYSIKDAWAREQISGLGNAMHFKGKIAELPNPVGYTGAAGDVYIVGTKEYVYVADETPAWIELGDEGSHVVKGTYTVTLTPSKSSVTSSGSYQPAGSVSKPTFTGDGTSITVETEKNVVTDVSGGQVTMPNGTVSKPTFTGTTATITSTGSYQPTGEVSKPIFTGTTANITSTGSFQLPDITYIDPTFSGTTATITSTSSYRPAGSISLTGKTDDQAIKTLTTAQAVASASVDGELLTLTTGTYATGAGSTVSVVSGLTGATFSGTTATITSTASYRPAGSATGGTAYYNTVTMYETITVTSTGSYQPTGEVSKPIFTGTTATVTVKSDYQPAGTVSQPTFSWATTNSTKTVGVASLTVSKEKVTSSGAYTPTGSVSQPTFTGTTATITVTSSKEYMESVTGSVALS